MPFTAYALFVSQHCDPVMATMRKFEIRSDILTHTVCILYLCNKLFKIIIIISANVKVHYRVNTGTSDMGTINSSDRIAATLYSLGTVFVSGICV
jgi:hypothetical protein